MGTIGTIILLVVIFFIGKFIYDSYITDNTEKDWQEFKKIDPKKAEKIENSDFSRKPKINDVIDESDEFRVKELKKMLYDACAEHLQKDIDNYYRYSEVFNDEITTALELSEVITQSSEQMKEAFLEQKVQLKLEASDIISVVHDATRSSIKKNLKIDLG